MTRMRTATVRTPWRHGLALWFLIIACESVNGSVRELFLTPWLGQTISEPISFAVASIVILFVATLFSPWMRATTTAAQLQIGALWAVLTFAFEAALAIGMAQPIDAFVARYDPARGGPMLVGMLVLLLAPWLGARLHSRMLAERAH